MAIEKEVTLKFSDRNDAKYDKVVLAMGKGIMGLPEEVYGSRRV